MAGLANAAAMAMVMTATSALAGDPACLLGSSSYSADMTFVDAGQLEQTRMTVTWDGVNLWTSSGGSSSGERLSQYTSGGSFLSDYFPGRDVRSVFTKGDGTGPVYMRSYASSTIDVQTSPGSFTYSTSLSGGSLDAHLQQQHL